MRAVRAALGVVAALFMLYVGVFATLNFFQVRDATVGPHASSGEGGMAPLLAFFYTPLAFAAVAAARAAWVLSPAGAAAKGGGTGVPFAFAVCALFPLAWFGGFVGAFDGSSAAWTRVLWTFAYHAATAVAAAVVCWHLWAAFALPGAGALPEVPRTSAGRLVAIGVGEVAVTLAVVAACLAT